MLTGRSPGSQGRSTRRHDFTGRHHDDRHQHPTTSRTWLNRAASMGAVAGVIASLMMAAYAMIAAATYQGSGFFAPLYHIASTFISPDHMMSSMKSATMGGSNFEFFAGPALLAARTRSPTWPSSSDRALSSSCT